MSKSTSATPMKPRQFKSMVSIAADDSPCDIGENVQVVKATVKIVDETTGETVRFDPKTIMVHPSGGRIEISGVVSRDGTGNGVPAGIPDITDKV